MATACALVTAVACMLSLVPLVSGQDGDPFPPGGPAATGPVAAPATPLPPASGAASNAKIASTTSTAGSSATGIAVPATMAGTHAASATRAASVSAGGSPTTIDPSATSVDLEIRVVEMSEADERALALHWQSSAQVLSPLQALQLGRDATSPTNGSTGSAVDEPSADAADSPAALFNGGTSLVAHHADLDHDGRFHAIDLRRVVVSDRHVDQMSVEQDIVYTKSYQQVMQPNAHPPVLLIPSMENFRTGIVLWLRPVIDRPHQTITLGIETRVSELSRVGDIPFVYSSETPSTIRHGHIQTLQSLFRGLVASLRLRDGQTIALGGLSVPGSQRTDAMPMFAHTPAQGTADPRSLVLLVTASIVDPLHPARRDNDRSTAGRNIILPIWSIASYYDPTILSLPEVRPR